MALLPFVFHPYAQCRHPDARIGHPINNTQDRVDLSETQAPALVARHR
jgi:hypothetical protein